MRYQWRNTGQTLWNISSMSKRRNYTFLLDLTIQTVRNPQLKWLRPRYWAERKCSEGTLTSTKIFWNSMEVAKNCSSLMEKSRLSSKNLIKPMQNTSHFWNFKDYGNIWSWLKRLLSGKMYALKTLKSWSTKE